MAAKQKSKKKNKNKNDSKKPPPAPVVPLAAIEAGLATMSVSAIKQSEQTDPMKLFPFELAVKAFSHLNISETIQCRAVCKAWQAIIDSKDIKLMMVKHWETHDPSDSARKLSTSDASDAERTKDIEQRYQLLKNQFCGRPVKQHLLKRTKPAMKGSTNWTLKGRYLAHLGPLKLSTNTVSCVYLHDLITGTAKKITPNGHVDIENVLLTEDLLAYWGDDRLCVMDLHNPNSETRIVKLPGVALSGPGYGYKQYVAFYGLKEYDYSPTVWFYDYEKDSFKVFDSTATTDALRDSESCSAIGLAIDAHHATGKVYCALFSATLNRKSCHYTVKGLNTVHMQIEYLTLDGVSQNVKTIGFKSKVSDYIAQGCYWIAAYSTGIPNIYHLRTSFMHHGVTNDIVISLRALPRIISTVQRAAASALWKNIWYQSLCPFDYAIKCSRQSLQGDDHWRFRSFIRRDEVNMHGIQSDMCINDSFLVTRVRHHGEMFLHVLYFDESLAHAQALEGRTGIKPPLQRPRSQLASRRRLTDHAFVWYPGNWSLDQDYDSGHSGVTCKDRNISSKCIECVANSTMLQQLAGDRP